MKDHSIFHPVSDKSWLKLDLTDFSLELRRLFEPYRPERHYMRGPGPKWRAKHENPGAATVKHTPIRNVCQLTYLRNRLMHHSRADVGHDIANRGGIMMLNIRAAITAIAAITVALFAFSANAHEYRSQSGGVSQTNQWDINKAAPFARDENDRFTP